jgi:hypothetical protein
MQLSLFDNPRTSQRESLAVSRETKAAAHRSLDAESQQERVLCEIRASGAAGLTRNEIAAQMGIPLASVCGRVNTLLELGEVFQSGAKRERRAVVFAKGSV